MSKYKPLAHRLKDNKTEQRPRNLVFLALSTRATSAPSGQKIHHLHTGAASYIARDARYPQRQPETMQFSSASEWWDWLESHCRARERVYVVSSSALMSFTVLGGFHELPKRGWAASAILYAEGLCILDWRKNRYTLRCLDIANLLRNYRDCDSDLLARCQRLYLATIDYLGFLDEHECGSFAMSAAGQAYNAYRHRHMATPIYIHHDRALSDYERTAYYGGRNECYQLGTRTAGPYWLLDVNSMYGSVMAEERYPTKLLYRVRRPSLAVLHDSCCTSTVIADVDIATDTSLLPCRIGQSVYFPVGQFRTVLCQAELVLALELGLVSAVHAMSVYACAPLFRSFVEHFYGYRWVYHRSGDTHREQACKLMINSLYGKFGQRGLRWTDVGEADPHALEYRIVYNSDGSETHERCLLGKRQQMIEGPGSLNAFVAISACVTSAARVKLSRYMRQAGDGNVLYVDTDSLIVNQAGYDNLSDAIDRERLGALKVQAMSKMCRINGLKDYSIADIIKLKGIPRSAKGDNLSGYEWDEAEGLMQMLHAGDLNEYHTRRIRMTPTRWYRKGNVDAHGIISPFRLPFAAGCVPPQFVPPHPGWLVASE